MAPEGQTGKSVVALGMIDALTREVESVGVFRPVIRAGQARDQLLQSMIAEPGVKQSYSQAVGVTYDQVRANPDEAMTELVNRYGAIKDRYDAIVILGSDYRDVTSSTELSFNARVAANLNAPVALCLSALGRTPEQVRALAENALAEVASHHARTIALFATRCAPGHADEFQAALSGIAGDAFVSSIEEHPLLTAATIGDQFEAVGATMLVGRHEQLSRESQSVLVAGMTLPNVLERLSTEATIVLPSDRGELIPGILLAQTSGAFPQLAGMILVGGYEIPSSIRKLMDSVHHELPIGVTTLGTYTSAEKLFGLRGIMSNSPRKIETGRRLFNERVDIRGLMDKMSLVPSPVTTPLMFEYQLNEMARRHPRTIVLPEASDDRILEAASIVLRRGTAGIILLGDPTVVKQRASLLGLSLEGAEIVDPSDPELIDRFAAEYARLRAHKGVTLEQAREKLKDLSYVGTMMVHTGMAHGMVSGAVNTTANTIRPSLEFIKTKPGVKVVSSSFLMCMPNRVDVYGDCAVNPDPTAEELAGIAISSAETAVTFGIDPRVAMLSYSTGTSGSGAGVDKVAEATRLVHELDPDLKVDGPIQFDAAVDPTVGQKKMPGSLVAGQATVFIFPDLNTGNNTYKAVQRSSGAVAIGPVLQGLNKPVNDLSRGALVEDIVNTIAITAIQAQHS